MSCNVCFNFSNNLVTCENCSKINCKNCISKYIKSQTQSQNCCPSCKCIWSDIFIKNSFSFSFLKNYHKIKYKIAFEEHYNNRADSMGTVTNIKNIQKRKKELFKLISEIKKINVIHVTPYFYIKRNILDEQKDRKKYFLKHIAQMEKLVVLENELDYINAINPKYNIPKGLYIRICPNVDCHGMLNEELICKLCEIELCKNCHVENLNFHVCKEADIETKLFLEKKSVSCPKCHTIILKVDGGCNHMWCRKCKISFDWESGLTINGRVSNPERFRYQRETENEGTPKDTEDTRIEKQKNFITDFLENSELSYFHRDYDEIVEDIRINFLLGYISYEDYFRQYKNNFKHFCIVNEIINLCENYFKCKLDFVNEYTKLYDTITFFWSDIIHPNDIIALDIF